MLRRITAGLAAAASVAALTVFPADSATASAPQCTTTAHVLGIDNAGDPAPLVLPASSSGNTYCWLARGDYSPAVYALQDAMYRCNQGKLSQPYDERNLARDSDYGPNTANAVRDMQYWGGIAQDGVYGSQTRGVMEFPTAPGWWGADCGGTTS